MSGTSGAHLRTFSEVRLLILEREVIGQMIHIADSDKVLLDALSHRNALILSHLPDIPLLFAGRVNTVMERILRGKIPD